VVEDLDDENAQRLMDASGDYRYYLEEMRHFKPHTLSEPEEKVINLKDVTGAQALITLYDSITIVTSSSWTWKARPKELTRGQLMAYVQGPDPTCAPQPIRIVSRLQRRWSHFGADVPDSRP